MKSLNNYIMRMPATIRDAVKKMDVCAVDSLIITESDKVIGLFTIGDFRRAVLNGLDINADISFLVNREYKYLLEGYKEADARAIFNENDLILDLPVLNREFELVDVISRNNVYTECELREEKSKMVKVSVVIMAGGNGTRMEPFTRVLPKPLIPIGDDPIIKVIMDEFRKYEMCDFHISINDKGQMIKAYFHDHDLPYSIQYIEENKPLGTAGALRHLKGKLSEAFFVTNCDIIIHTNYSAILDFHIKGEYDLTLIASMRNYIIPYGICEMDNEGNLKSIKEKPEYDFLVNTGLYVLEPKVLKLIPGNTYFDMTDLINKIQANGMKVGVFPVSEKSWLDVGQWAEYKKTLDVLNIGGEKVFSV